MVTPILRAVPSSCRIAPSMSITLRACIFIYPSACMMKRKAHRLHTDVQPGPLYAAPPSQCYVTTIKPTYLTFRVGPPPKSLPRKEGGASRVCFPFPSLRGEGQG